MKHLSSFPEDILTLIPARIETPGRVIEDLSIGTGRNGKSL